MQGIRGPIGRLSSLYRGESAVETRRWRPLPARHEPVAELLQATRTITRSGIQVMHTAAPYTRDHVHDLLSRLLAFAAS